MGCSVISGQTGFVWCSYLLRDVGGTWDLLKGQSPHHFPGHLLFLCKAITAFRCTAVIQSYNPVFHTSTTCQPRLYGGPHYIEIPCMSNTILLWEYSRIANHKSAMASTCLVSKKLSECFTVKSCPHKTGPTEEDLNLYPTVHLESQVSFLSSLHYKHPMR